MKVLDKVWMLVSEKEDCVIYCIGGNAQEVWDKTINEEVMGTGVSKSDLIARGFAAKKVAICEE